MASSVQNSPAVAANGDNYLVVWRDSRFTGIYGNIIASDGGVLVTNGFPICTAANDQYTPAAAALGTNYLVAWQDYRKATSSQYYSDIYAARVTGAGVLMDTNGIPVCTRTNSQFHPAVAANGTNFLVVWEDYDLGGDDIFGARVSPDGQVLDSDGITLAHAANLQANPAAAVAGGDFLVVWQDYRDSATNNFEAKTYGARVSNSGLVNDPNGVIFASSSGGQTCPTVASLGTECFVVWQDFRNNPATTFADIYGAKIDAAGALGVHPELKVSGSANAELSPAVAANGTNFLVVWADNRNALANGLDIYGARLDLDGALLDLAPLTICTATNNQADPTVAAYGASYLVVWSDKRNATDNAGSSDIYGAVVTSGGIVLQPSGVPICTATNDQILPALATLGTNFLVVWQDARNSVPSAVRWDVYGARLTSDGGVLDPAGIPICTYLPDQTIPVVAGNLSQALVVWIDSRGAAGASHVYGTRLGLDGTVADTNGFAICTAAGQQLAPAVASDGKGYFVVWADSRNGLASGLDIYGAMVDAGAVVSPTNGFPIRRGPAQQTAPSVAFNGSNYLVAWQEGVSGSTNFFDIFGTTIEADGSLSGGSLLLINTNPANQVGAVAAAEPDGRFLVLNQVFESSSVRTVGNLVDAVHLEVAGSFTNGQFQFRLVAASGRRYAIEASDDLNTWSQLATVLSTNISTLISDPASTNLPKRFYRAILLP